MERKRSIFSGKRKIFAVLITSILLMNIFMLTYTINAFTDDPTDFSGVVSTTSLNIEGGVFGDYGDNGSTSMNYYGDIPVMWNASSTIPFVFGYHITDNTNGSIALFRIILSASFKNSGNESIYNKSSVILSLQNVGYGHLDGMMNTIEWEMFPQVTGITTGTYWTGDIYLEGSISYEGESFTNTSDALQIIYSYNYTLPTTNPPPFEIPVSVFWGVIILMFTGGTLVTISFKNRRD